MDVTAISADLSHVIVDYDQVLLLISDYNTNKWQQLWNENNTGTQYKPLISLVGSMWVRFPCSRKEEKIIAQLHLQRTYTNEYLYKIKKSDTELSPYCSASKDTASI